MSTFDVVVVGGRPAGEERAGRLAAGGLDVAIVEDRLIGGVCAYRAYPPSKALLRPYEALAEARRVPGASEACTRWTDGPLRALCSVSKTSRVAADGFRSRTTHVDLRRTGRMDCQEPEAGYLTKPACDTPTP